MDLNGTIFKVLQTLANANTRSILKAKSLQFEVCRFINTQSVLKIPFQISKTRENAKNVLKIIFSTVLAFSRDFAV